MKIDRTVVVLLRLALGFIFLWAFLDKTFGLGYATAKNKSWLEGISPTTGFLKSAVYGPFADFFKGLAGSAFVDWLFMLGLLFVGLALIFGLALKLAAWAGAIILALMWLALLPPKNNPFLDDHLIYILVLFGLKSANAGDSFGLGRWWQKTSLVKRYPILR